MQLGPNAKAVEHHVPRNAVLFAFDGNVAERGHGAAYKLCDGVCAVRREVRDLGIVARDAEARRTQRVERDDVIDVAVSEVVHAGHQNSDHARWCYRRMIVGAPGVLSYCPRTKKSNQ